MSTIFISYSRADKDWLELAEKHIRVLGAAVDVWHDQRMSSGIDWRQDINDALQRARVAVLLISVDFLNSKFVKECELPVIIQARRDRGLMVYPVVVRPCAWQESFIAGINIRHTYDRALLLLSEGQREEILSKIAREIAEHLATTVTCQDSAAVSAVPSPKPETEVDSLTRILDKGTAVIDVARDLVSTAGHAGRALGNEVKQIEALFAALNEHGKRLASGKRIHDELHLIEFQCLGRLMCEARLLPDPKAREQIDSYLKDLERAVDRLRDAVGGSSDPPWLAELDADVGKLRTVLSAPAPDPRQMLLAAAAVERDTSLQLTSVNGKMLRALGDYDFAPLEESLEALARSLVRTDPATHTKLQEPLAEFCKLRHELTTLIEQHDAWQGLYNELRNQAPCAEPTDAWRQEIEIYWPDLEEDIGELCATRKDKLAGRLQKESEDFGRKLASGGWTAKGAAETFAALRQMFAKGFFKVDGDLKKTFESLVRRTGDFRT